MSVGAAVTWWIEASSGERRIFAEADARSTTSLAVLRRVVDALGFAAALL